MATMPLHISKKNITTRFKAKEQQTRSGNACVVDSSNSLVGSSGLHTGVQDSATISFWRLSDCASIFGIRYVWYGICRFTFRILPP
jgi:hypothetical protein